LIHGGRAVLRFARGKTDPRSRWLSDLEERRGRKCALCAEQEISQAQYYQWRDLFLANAAKAFEPAGAPQCQGVSGGAKIPHE
jgi:hypothetical protein